MYTKQEYVPLGHIWQKVKLDLKASNVDLRCQMILTYIG